MTHSPVHSRFRGWQLADGILFIGAIVILKLLVELHPLVRERQAGMMMTLQERLQERRDGYDLPVVVFDISAIPRVQQGPGLKVTPREPLLALLEALAETNAPPRAVAIDIDFSALNGASELGILGRLSMLNMPLDAELFRKARELTHAGMPVYLGVGREVFAPPGQWLPAGADRENAGGMLLGSVPWRMPMGTGAPPEFPAWRPRHEAGELLPGLGERLGRVLTPRRATPATEQKGWRKLASNVIPVHLREGQHVFERTMNLSHLAALRDSRVPVLPGEEKTAVRVAAERLPKSVVLIGDGVPQDARDRVRVPGFQGHELAGIYFHACAALTPMLGDLYELTSLGRLLADVALALAVLGIVSLICAAHDEKVAGRRLRPGAVHWLVTGIAAVFVWVAGYWVVPYTRLLWIDFDLVALVLLLHRPFEYWLHGLGKATSELTLEPAKAGTKAPQALPSRRRQAGVRALWGGALAVLFVAVQALHHLDEEKNLVDFHVGGRTASLNWRTGIDASDPTSTILTAPLGAIYRMDPASEVDSELSFVDAFLWVCGVARSHTPKHDMKDVWTSPPQNQKLWLAATPPPRMAATPAPSFTPPPK